MSKTSDTVEEFRARLSPDARGAAGALRRLGIGHSLDTFWQVYGHLLLDGRTKETREAEVFSGIGFYSRPPDDANSEAIVTFIGGAENPVIIATRDEDTRKKVANATALGANGDETYLYNSQVVLRLSNSGLIQAFLIGGPVPVKLALQSDVDGVITAHNAHKHPDPQGGVTGLPDSLAPASVGSSVLRG